MMHARERMENFDPDVILSLQISAMAGRQNVLTIHSDGRVIYQPDLSTDQFQLKFDNTGNDVEEYLKANNLPVDSFLALQSVDDHYYEIRSERTCGVAANLFLRIGSRENWIGIWNFGRGEIPQEVDAGMYQAVIKLADHLKECGKGEKI
jgi:hypothetical protein